MPSTDGKELDKDVSENANCHYSDPGNFLFRLQSPSDRVRIIFVGSIAQPGERPPHTREVTGSSPVAPTTLELPLNRIEIARLNGFLFCSQESGKYICRRHGQHTRHHNGETGHSAFDFPDLHRLGGAHRVGGGADRHALCYRLRDMKQPEKGFRKNPAQNPGDDDGCHGDCGISAHLRAQADANRGRDRLREQGDKHRVVEMEGSGKDQDRHHAGENARKDAEDNRPSILFQDGKFIIERYGEADRRRRHQVVENAHPAVIIRIIDPKENHHDDRPRDRDQERIKQRHPESSLQLNAEQIKRHGGEHSEKRGTLQEIIHHFSSFRSLRTSHCVTLPETPNTAAVETTRAARNAGKIGLRTSQESTSPTAGAMNIIGIVSIRKVLTSRIWSVRKSPLCRHSSIRRMP